MRTLTVIAAALAALSVAGCGSSDAGQTAVLGVSTLEWELNPRLERASQTVVRRPIVAGTPLLYDRGTTPREYVVVFRATRPFVGRAETGETRPGSLTLEGHTVDPGDFRGSIGRGTSSGKCYVWDVDAAGAQLGDALVSEPIGYAFRLWGAAEQTGQTILRGRPTARELAADLKSIGCARQADSAADPLAAVPS